MDISKELVDDLKKEDNDKNNNLNIKEQKKLKNFKKQNYINCNKTFLIKNKKTERIVEITAPSILLAAKAIGWRINHIILLEEKGDK